MEHVTITEVKKGSMTLLRLVPDKGWQLYNKNARQFFSDAEVKPEKIDEWTAVEA